MSRRAVQRAQAPARDGPASADELARATGLSAERVAVLLSELELAGVAEESAGVFRAV